MQFWDYRGLPSRTRRTIFLSVVILANATSIVLSAITSHPDRNDLITTTFIAPSSTMVRILQILSTPHKREAPHVRKAMVTLLVAVTIPHIAFIVFLHLKAICQKKLVVLLCAPPKFSGPCIAKTGGGTS